MHLSGHATLMLLSVVRRPGSYVLDVEASPMLRGVVINASQQTPSSDALFDGASAETLYDTWLLRSPADFDNFMPRSAHCFTFLTALGPTIL